MPGKKGPGKITKIPLPRPDIRSLSNLRFIALYKKFYSYAIKGMPVKKAYLTTLDAEKKRRIKIGTMKSYK